MMMFDSMMIKSLKHDRTVEVHSSAELWQPPWQLDGRTEEEIDILPLLRRIIQLSWSIIVIVAKIVKVKLLLQKIVVFKMKGI